VALVVKKLWDFMEPENSYLCSQNLAAVFILCQMHLDLNLVIPVRL